MPARRLVILFVTRRLRIRITTAHRLARGSLLQRLVMMHGLRNGAGEAAGEPRKRALLSLALAAGAAGIAFTLVNALLGPALPVARPERLVAVYTREAKGAGDVAVSFLDYSDLRRHAEIFSGLVAHLPVSLDLGRPGQSQRIRGAIVSANYFPVLGVRPALGRAFLPEEDQVPGAHPVAVVSDDFWRRRFGGAAAAIGRSLTLNRRDFAVVGVAPPGFAGPLAGAAPDVWVPLTMHESFLAALGERVYQRRTPLFQVFGRLAPEVAPGQAQAALDTLAHQLARERQTDGARGFTLVPLVEAPVAPGRQRSIALATGLLAALAVAFPRVAAPRRLARRGPGAAGRAPTLE